MALFVHVVLPGASGKTTTTTTTKATTTGKNEKKKETSQIAQKQSLNRQERIAIETWLEALWKSQLNQFCLRKGTIATFAIYPSIYDVNSAGFRQHFNSEEGGVPLFASTSSTTQCSQ